MTSTRLGRWILAFWLGLAAATLPYLLVRSSLDRNRDETIKNRDEYGRAILRYLDAIGDRVGATRPSRLPPHQPVD